MTDAKDDSIIQATCDYFVSTVIIDYPIMQPRPLVYITDIEFADDIVLLGEFPAAIQKMIHQLTIYAANVGLRSTKRKFFDLPNLRRSTTFYH